MELTSRELLSHLFHTAIDAVDGRHRVYQWCAKNQQHNFKYCLAIGKAAPAMLQGALDSNSLFDHSLLICRKNQISGSLRKNKNISIIESAHPVPDQSSLDAGAVLLSFLAEIAEGEKLLVLISGGASSLVEVLQDNLSLEDLQEISNYLLSSGKSIHGINFWRKKISRIKGGGLLAHVNASDCVQLLISDVRDDDLSIIGSGLLVASSADEADEDVWLHERCPDVMGNSSSNSAIESHVIATLEMAKQAIKHEVEHMGVDVYLHDEFVDGDAIKQGRSISQWLGDAPAGVHIWGGETTVCLPARPGLGGRNQTLALAMSEKLEGRDICVMCVGTDGIDGNTPCAGAVVTGDTAGSARRMGFDINEELKKANAGTVLMATGDLFKSGATSTNVMDVIIAYKKIKNFKSYLP